MLEACDIFVNQVKKLIGQEMLDLEVRHISVMEGAPLFTIETSCGTAI